MALANSLDQGDEVTEMAAGESRSDRPDRLPSRPFSAASQQPGRGLIRVRNRAVATAGFPGRRGSKPRPIGIVGEVDQIADDVHGLEPGTRVIGVCRQLPRDPSWVELSARHAARVTATVDDATAAMAPLAGLMAWQGLARLAGVRSGQLVCVVGAASWLGGWAVQIARHLGAMVTTVSDQEDRAYCERLGSQWARAFGARPGLGEQEHDVILDTVGSSVADYRRMLARDGVYLTTVSTRRSRLDELRTTMSLGQRTRLLRLRPRKADLETVAGWLDDQPVRVPASPNCSLDEFPDAVRREGDKPAHSWALTGLAD